MTCSRVPFRRRTLLIIVIVAAPAHWAAAEEPLEKLRAEKLAAAKEMYRAVEVGHEAGVNTVGEYYAASKGWKDAAYEIAKTKTERVAALEQHRDRMEALHKQIHELAAANRRGGEADKEAAARFWVAQSKIWLAEEKAKP